MPIVKAYYFGEFGYLNFHILGALERKLTAEPDVQLELVSYPDYITIVRSLFPKQIVRHRAWLTDGIADVRDQLRKFHDLDDDVLCGDLERQGFRNLAEILGCQIYKDWYEARQRIALLETPLVDRTRAEPPVRFVSMLCRNRRVGVSRNLPRTQWDDIVTVVRSVRAYRAMRIVFHGLPDETIDMSHVPNSTHCTDIRESMYYLNHSQFFVSSMSGFAQFASNCCCNILQIGRHDQMVPYNPFNKINLCLPQEELVRLRGYVRRFEGGVLGYAHFTMSQWRSRLSGHREAGVEG